MFELPETELELVPTSRIVDNLKRNLINRKDLAQANWEIARAYTLAATKVEVQIEKGSNNIPSFSLKEPLIKGGDQNIKSAIEYYNKAIEMNADNINYLLGRGWCYKVLSQKERALIDIRKVFKESAALHLALFKGGILAKKRESGQASSQRKKALEEEQKLSFQVMG